MKHLLAMAICLLAAIAAPVAHAQFDTVHPDDISLQISKFNIDEVRFSDSFPAVEGVDGGGDDEWLRFQVEYETEFKPTGRTRYEGDEHWLDLLEIRWHIILATQAGRRNYIDERAVSFQKNVRYTNVLIGKRKHLAVVYLEPRIIQRYAQRLSSDLVFTRMEILAQGKTIGQLHAKGKKYVTDERTAAQYNPRGARGSLFDSLSLVKPLYGLLSRDQTPWEWSSYDEYETIIRDSERR